MLYLEYSLPSQQNKGSSDVYPSVHLTSPHKWDPSVLDYVHQQQLGGQGGSIPYLNNNQSQAFLGKVQNALTIIPESC